MNVPISECSICQSNAELDEDRVIHILEHGLVEGFYYKIWTGIEWKYGLTEKGKHDVEERLLPKLLERGKQE